jgi:hypothetical protein
MQATCWFFLQNFFYKTCTFQFHRYLMAGRIVPVQTKIKFTWVPFVPYDTCGWEHIACSCTTISVGQSLYKTGYRHFFPNSSQYKT